MALVVYGDEIAQQFQQSASFCILPFAVVNISKKRFNMFLEYCQFIHQCRIEHYIRLFLKWKYVFFFSVSDISPHCNSLYSIMPSVAAVPHYSPISLASVVLTLLWLSIFNCVKALI